MKNFNINTEKNENDSGYWHNNNGFSFPQLTGATNQQNQSTATISANEILISKPNANYYSICVDWLEFICATKNPIELTYKLNQNQNIQIRKIDVHNNPNFTNLNRIYFNGTEICDILSTPNNNTHKPNEVSVKMANHVLYSNQCYQYVLLIVEAFKLSFDRLARLDIALDGMDIVKLISLLNRYSKSKTIQTNNDAITILPTSFRKQDQFFDSWCIGKSKSGISARVYNKTDEINQSGKDYIREYWNANGLTTVNNGRFEIQLNSKRLDKYHFFLSDLQRLMDAEFLGSIFKKEVQSWLKFYHVRKADILNHKKEVAIKKGSEIQFIKWQKIPTKQIQLKNYDYKSNSTAINARNAISFTLIEILLNPSTSTTAMVETVQKYADDYNLQDYLRNKIIRLFGVEVKSPYLPLIQPLLNSGVSQKITPSTD